MNRDVAERNAVARIVPTAIEAADAALAEPDEGFRLHRVDLPKLLIDGVPEAEYVDPPYVPRGARIWSFGAAESSKTIFWQNESASQSRGRSRTYQSLISLWAVIFSSLSRT